MSKAEDRALEAYPKATRDIDGIVVDVGHPQYMRDIYIEGYLQAEKDLELGLEDMVLFRTLFDAIDVNIRLGSIKVQPMTKEYYQEVLKRFKKLKGEQV